MIALQLSKYNKNNHDIRYEIIFVKHLDSNDRVLYTIIMVRKPINIYYIYRLNIIHNPSSRQFFVISLDGLTTSG